MNLAIILGEIFILVPKLFNRSRFFCSSFNVYLIFFCPTLFFYVYVCAVLTGIEPRTQSSPAPPLIALLVGRIPVGNNFLI